MYRQRQKAFSIIELVVSIAIMAMVVTALFLSNSRFGSALLVANMAYDTALVIRQAQAYGMTVREWKADSSATQNFNAGYGIRFSKHDVNANYAKKKFVMFYDSPTNASLSTPSGNRCCGSCGSNTTYRLQDCRNVTTEFLKDYAIDSQRVIIKKIAAYFMWGASETSHSYDFTTTAGSLVALDITFERPKADAYIATHLSGINVCFDLLGRNPCLINYTRAEITFSNPAGSFEKTVVVTRAGQIYVR